MAVSGRPPPSPMPARRPAPGRSTIVVALTGRIARADIPGLCERVGARLEAGATDLVVCDVGALVDPDAVAVDALARLQLMARRSGRRIWLRHPCDELKELLALMGLCDVVPCVPD